MKRYRFNLSYVNLTRFTQPHHHRLVEDLKLDEVALKWGGVFGDASGLRNVA